MRHFKKGRKFGRVRKQRRAMLKGLASSFIIAGKMRTTLAKAKELQPAVEKIISKAKENSVSSRRYASSMLNSRALKSLFSDVAPLFKERRGGYTRIMRLGRRASDAAEMAIIELVK
jgi:large subunit ribosomal protein L17